MLTFVAAVLSGLLWLGGVGLHPIAALTWLAPLPLLLIAVRRSPRATLAATVLAWLIGQLGMVGYYFSTLQIPAQVIAAVMVYGAGLAAGTILLARALLLRGHIVIAILAVPALWVLGEYFVSIAMPNGAWWSLAYTQADVRPVIQLTAVTGIGGVTYLLVAVPIAVTALVTASLKHHPVLTGGWRAALGCLIALTVPVGGWAAWSLTRPPGSAENLQAGLVALEQPEDAMPLSEASGRDLLARYVPRVTALTTRGATVVVLPEKVFGVDDTTLPRLVDAFRPVTDGGAQVVVGAVLKQAGDHRNVALVLGAGGAVTAYTKQHLIQGLEDDWLTPGDDDLIVKGHLGVAICKDLDFPDLVRRYRAKGATTLLVPALDFTSDGWLHSRMALVRGVETGVTVVRAADFGRLTVTDPTGRVLGEATAGDAEMLVTVVPAGRGTLYARTGNWFLILSALLFVIAVAAGPVSSRRRAGLNR
jgi:apolipoprotein N-acyltransferase